VSGRAHGQYTSREGSTPQTECSRRSSCITVKKLYLRKDRVPFGGSL
jgi:hypothetical protein